MFLRHTTRTKNGKTHTYWRLVRSVRVGNTVRQRTVANLGELDEKGRARARTLARNLGFRDPGPGLFDEPADIPDALPVLHREVRLERSRSFGGPWLGHELWRALGLDDLLRRLLPSGRETVPWEAVVEILAVSRLCEPSSELHIEESWYRTTAFEDILGVRPEQVNTDRLYRALDLLLPHKVAIERHLKSWLGDLFEIPYDLMLYDLTSTYFEGQALGNPDARYGHSSDRREDCKQVCIGLVVSRDGMPFGYEVFPGNQAGVTTVKRIVRSMEDRYGKPAERIWIMDRGMVSDANLAWLREEGREYLVGAPRSVLKGYEPDLIAARGWEEVRPGVSAKLCEGPEAGETLVVCRSQDRRAKEAAVCEHFSRRIEKRLTSLQRRLEKARKQVDRDKVAVQIGRILGQNTRAAGRYKVRIETDARRASGLAVRFTANPKWAEWTEATEGSYALRTNVDASGWSAEDLWLTYVLLTDAESAFRTHKHDLRLRPVWHQKAERVKAHILVCFLAYVMWRFLGQWQKRAGLGEEPRKIIEEIGRIQSADVVLPTADGRELRLRCVVQPEPSQKILLDRLGLTLPKRLRTPAGVEM